LARNFRGDGILPLKHHQLCGEAVSDERCKTGPQKIFFRSKNRELNGYFISGKEA
jgi:hypothetical protein